MRNILTVAALSFIVSSALAAGDPVQGKKIHDASCVNCHVKVFGGDGNQVYTRTPRLVYDRDSLARRVTHCAVQSGANWLPDEEEHVVAYLNQAFYHFDK